MSHNVNGSAWYVFLGSSEWYVKFIQLTLHINGALLGKTLKFSHLPHSRAWLLTVQYLEKLYINGWGIKAAGCVQN